MFTTTLQYSTMVIVSRVSSAGKQCARNNIYFELVILTIRLGDLLMNTTQKSGKVSAVDALVRTIVKKNYRDALIIAMGLGASQELFEELLPMCIESYCANTTIPLLRDAKFSLPQTAIDKFVLALLENEGGGGGLHYAIDAVALGPSDEVLLRVFERCSAQGILRLAEHMKEGFLLPETIDRAIEGCLNRKDDFGSEIINVAKLGASQRCIDSLVLFFLEKEKIGDAQDAARLGASMSVVDRVVDATIAAGINLGTLHTILEQLSSTAVEHLIAQAITEANSKYAITFARYRPLGKLTPIEVETLVSRCIETCINEYNVVSAYEAARQRAIPRLAESEITLLIGRCVQRKSAWGVVAAAGCRSSGRLTAEEMQDLAEMYSGSVRK
jgi:hypothetical protein